MVSERSRPRFDAFRPLAGDFLSAPTEHSYQVPTAEQFRHGSLANDAGSSCHQYFHSALPLISTNRDADLPLAIEGQVGCHAPAIQSKNQ